MKWSGVTIFSLILIFIGLILVLTGIILMMMNEGTQPWYNIVLVGVGSALVIIGGVVLINFDNQPYAGQSMGSSTTQIIPVNTATVYVADDSDAGCRLSINDEDYADAVEMQSTMQQ